MRATSGGSERGNPFLSVFSCNQITKNDEGERKVLVRYACTSPAARALIELQYHVSRQSMTLVSEPEKMCQHEHIRCSVVSTSTRVLEQVVGKSFRLAKTILQGVVSPRQANYQTNEELRGAKAYLAQRCDLLQ